MNSGQGSGAAANVILHIGAGSFHRAHQAVYLDELFNRKQDLDWALVGAGVGESDNAMRRDLAAQDLLTTVVEQESDHSAARITGSIAVTALRGAMSLRRRRSSPARSRSRPVSTTRRGTAPATRSRRCSR